MDEIIEDLIDKMNKTSYDDTVILGTLLILLESNKDAYKTFFKEEEGKKIEITEDTHIFADIVSDILNKTHVEQEFEFNDFKANYNNLPQKNLLDDSDDPEKTQTNFEQNFVNLAQVFYEMQFCGDKLVTSDTNIQNIMVIVENMLLTKPKSLQVTYYNNKRLLNDDRIKQEEFANIANVDFGRAATLRDLKKRVSVPTESNIKHQIVVLDDPTMLYAKIQDLIDLCNVDTVMIVVNNVEGPVSEKEFVRIVSVEPLKKGGAKKYSSIHRCNDIEEVIKSENLTIGRHITNENFSKLLQKLNKSRKKPLTQEFLTNCLKNSGYSVVNDELCIKILSYLRPLFQTNPSSKDMITHEQFENLAKKVSRKDLLECLPKLGYKFQSSIECAKVDTLIKNSQEYVDDDFKDLITNLKGIKTKGETQNPQIEATTIDKCIPQLGYTVHQFEEEDNSRTAVDTNKPEIQPSSDPNVDTSQPKSIDCEGVKTLMQENSYKLDLESTFNNVEILAPLGQNKTPPISKETIQKCLTSFDDVAGPAAAESSTGTVGTDSSTETEKSSTGPVGTDSSTETASDAANTVSTDALSTGSPSTESIDAASTISTDAASTISTDAASTVSPSTGSSDSSTAASIMASSDSSIDASTDSSAAALTVATSPVATPPDRPKNKFGMYHGCSYKGYEFQAEIESNKVSYENEEDLDTIVRYLIFSNIVVFIVN